MKMKSIKIIHSILIISIFLAASCTRNIKEYKIETENAKYNLVFAGDSTVFKDNVRQLLIDKYKTTANIYMIDSNKLKELDSNEYDAVVIINTCIAGRPSYKELNSFIDNHVDKNKIILFITANNTSWKYSYKGVDAVTAASGSGNAESVFQEISERIDGVISEK